MPDPGRLVRAIDIPVHAPIVGDFGAPIPVFEDGIVRVTAVPVTHGHAHPALAYRFDTPDGSVVFSGDTTVNEDLIALAREADVLIHQVADLDYLERHGITGSDLQRMAGLHTNVTEVGDVGVRGESTNSFSITISRLNPTQLPSLNGRSGLEGASAAPRSLAATG